ncbi:MAG: hypothetical protein WC402_01225 [Candidatus Pacearchaeota archaeon]|jgi:hypothetical protein
MGPQQIILIYSVTTLEKRTFVSYNLSSPNGDSTHIGVLRRGDEDYNALSLFVNSRPNNRFDLVTRGMKLSHDKLESLEELLKMHNAAVKLLDNQ